MAALKDQQHAMTLSQLLSGVCATEYLPDIEIHGLALDSRKVETGYAFVAMQGQLEHGLAYAEAAVSRGAVVVLCDAEFDQYCQQILSRIMARVICVPIKKLRSKLNEITNKFYAGTHEKLFIAGITGTDGKTSVSHFIAQAMHQAYNSAAVVGTLGNGEINSLEEATHTTPDIMSLHEMLADYSRRGIKHVAMEVSSHGLDQERVSGISFDVAVLTNLSRDHLDYHGDLVSYKKAKKKLFTEHATSALVVNADDSFGYEIYMELKTSRDIWLYGLNKERASKSELFACAEAVVTHKEGIKFMLVSSHGVAEIALKLIGVFNIYNALACFCTLIQSGINFNHAVKYLENLSTVPGRMELLTEAGQAAVVIDYAHTPEALAQALSNVRKHVSGKLICVFGCGGERDSGKRPLMAQAAEQFADLLIITNDNPRNEDPYKIIDDIKSGINNESGLIIETDRRKAIAQALELAAENDLILIAGKGHEIFQIIANKKIDFNDRQVVLECQGAAK